MASHRGRPASAPRRGRPPRDRPGRVSALRPVLRFDRGLPGRRARPRRRRRRPPRRPRPGRPRSRPDDPVRPRPEGRARARPPPRRRGGPLRIGGARLPRARARRISRDRAPRPGPRGRDPGGGATPPRSSSRPGAFSREGSGWHDRRRRGSARRPRGRPGAVSGGAPAVGSFRGAPRPRVAAPGGEAALPGRRSGGRMRKLPPRRRGPAPGFSLRRARGRPDPRRARARGPRLRGRPAVRERAARGPRPARGDARPRGGQRAAQGPRRAGRAHALDPDDRAPRDPALDDPVAVHAGRAADARPVRAPVRLDRARSLRAGRA